MVDALDVWRGRGVRDKKIYKLIIIMYCKLTK